MVYPHRNLVMKISLGIIPLVQKNATKWRFLEIYTLREFKYWPQAEQLEPFDDTFFCTSIPSHLSRWIQESVPCRRNHAKPQKRDKNTN